jgi:hypothetical protein
MLKNLAWTLWAVIPVAVVTGIIVYARADVIAEPQTLAERGLATVARQDALGFAMLALVAGLLFASFYAWVWPRWRGATGLYVASGIVLGLGLSVAAAVLRPKFGLGGLTEVIALNLVWAAGFGWVAPAFVRVGAGSPGALFESDVAQQMVHARQADAGATLRRRSASDLPEQMQRYFRQAGVTGQPTMTAVSLQFEHAALRRSLESDWTPVRFDQANFVHLPARLVHIESHGSVPLDGRDSYLDGRGQMLIKVAGLFTVADMKGPEMDASALVTFLAELPLLPTACLEPYVQWRSVDSHRVEATLTHGRTTVRGIFEVNDGGEITRFTTHDRFMAAGDAPPVRARWIVEMADYEVLDGLRLPTRVRATWRLAKGDYEYARAKISSLRFVFPAASQAVLPAN